MQVPLAIVQGVYFIKYLLFVVYSYLPVPSVGKGLGRRVVENLLNLLVNLIRDLLGKLHRLDIVLNLLNLGGSQDHSADVGVLEAPGQGELRCVSTQALGNGSELLDLLDLGLSFLGLQGLDGLAEELLVGGEAGALGDAVVVLSSQETRGQGRPDGGTVVELLEEGLILDLEALTVEGVVLGLLDNRSDEVVSLGDLSGLGDLLGAPLRSSPVVGKVEVSDDLSEALNNLLERGGVVGSVGEDNVDIRLLETLQRALEALNDVLAAQTSGVGLLATSAKEDLCGEDVLVSGPVELLQSLSHLDLASSVGVDLGGVKGVDAVVPGGLQAVLDDVALLGASVGQPSSQGEHAHLEASGAQVAELHVLGVVRGLDNRHFEG